MATAKKYILAAHFQGVPKQSDLKIVEEKLPGLNDEGESTEFELCTRTANER